jgi:hypothetical protein
VTLTYLGLMMVAFTTATVLVNKYSRLVAEDVPPRRKARRNLAGGVICFLLASVAGVLAISAMDRLVALHLGWIVPVVWFFWAIALLILPSDKRAQADAAKREQARKAERRANSW